MRYLSNKTTIKISSTTNEHNINVHLDIIYFNTTVLLFSLNVITIFLPGNHPLFVFVCFLYNRIIKYVTIIGHQISELMFLCSDLPYFTLC